MIRKLLAAAGMAVLWLLPPAATAQQPAFDLVVRAPGPLQDLLERHLELRRYREVSDLDDAEIARLVVIAEKDARELLATQGYFSPQVRIQREPAEPRPKLVVEVEPGEATKVSAVQIDFEGDIANNAEPEVVAQREAIRAGWELRRGQGFTQDRWDAAKAAAVRELQAKRYPAGKISYSLADVDAGAHQAKLGLKLDSGAVFHLGEMKVTGVERYDSELVPRLARLPVGMVYDRDKIVQAQLRLGSSGYFDSAFIFVDPNGDPAAAPVQVSLREAPLQKVVLGVGFTTDGGPRASVEHTHNRVPGIGWRAVTKLQADAKNPFAQTEWTAIPDPEGWRWSTLLRAERLDDDRLVTDAQRLRFGRFRNEDHIDRNVYVQYERADVDNPNNVAITPADTGDGAAISVNYVWTGRYLDSIPFPNSGYAVGFELGAGYTLQGDNKPFQRTVARWLGYKPLTSGRLQMRAEAGAVLADKSAIIPATQLFRTGGDTTVRGYKFLDIGVPLADGYIGPGRYQAIASVEWQRPILRDGRPSDLESVFFVDAGAVADKVEDLEPNVGVGAGIRWKSPVGPVEAALAWGVKPQKLRLHIIVGFTF